MVCESEPDLEDRVRVLEHNVSQLVTGLSHARVWLILMGSTTAAAMEQLRELDEQALDAIREIMRAIGGE